MSGALRMFFSGDTVIVCEWDSDNTGTDALGFVRFSRAVTV